MQLFPGLAHNALGNLPSEATGNLDPGQYKMGMLIRQPIEWSQFYKFDQCIYEDIRVVETYRMFSFSGGRVENVWAHPLTVLKAKVSFDWLFFPSVLIAFLALSRVELFTAVYASSPQHFLVWLVILPMLWW